MLVLSRQVSSGSVDVGAVFVVIRSDVQLSTKIRSRSSALSNAGCCCFAQNEIFEGHLTIGKRKRNTLPAEGVCEKLVCMVVHWHSS